MMPLTKNTKLHPLSTTSFRLTCPGSYFATNYFPKFLPIGFFPYPGSNIYSCFKFGYGIFCINKNDARWATTL